MITTGSPPTKTPRTDLSLRALSLLVLASLAACASDSPEVAGRACFVLDLRRPHTCPVAQLVEGLQVHELVTDVTVSADADGRFHIPVTDATTQAVLRVAEDRTDVRTTLVGVDVAMQTDLVTPLITNVLWQSYIDGAHLPPDDPTTATIHVAFPPPGSNVASVQVEGATSIYFNQGDSYVWDVMPPGDQTVVFLALGVPVTTGTAHVTILNRDDTTRTIDTPVEAGAISWVYLDP